MKRLLMLLLLLLAIMTAPACATTGIFTPQNTKAAVNLAATYMYQGCTELTIAPAYTVNRSDGQWSHAGGVLIGGCGVLIEMSCYPPTEAEQADGKMISCDNLKLYKQQSPSATNIETDNSK